MADGDLGDGLKEMAAFTKDLTLRQLRLPTLLSPAPDLMVHLLASLDVIHLQILD